MPWKKRKINRLDKKNKKRIKQITKKKEDKSIKRYPKNEKSYRYR